MRLLALLAVAVAGAVTGYRLGRYAERLPDEVERKRRERASL